MNECPNCNSPNFEEVQVIHAETGVTLMEGYICLDCHCWQDEEE